MGLGIIGWLVIGIIAGWLAEKVMGRSHGLITNLIVGVLGALIGGFVAQNLLGTPVGGFNLVTLIVAFGGACLLLFLLGLEMTLLGLILYLVLIPKKFWIMYLKENQK